MATMMNAPVASTRTPPNNATRGVLMPDRVLIRDDTTARPVAASWSRCTSDSLELAEPTFNDGGCVSIGMALM